MISASTDWKEFAFTDAKKTQNSISSIIKRHQLSLNKKSESLQTRIRCAQFGQISLIRLSYGAEVHIQPEELREFYLIQIPQSGHAVVQSDNNKIESCEKTATVLNPHSEIDMVWKANNEQLMFKIDRSLIEKSAAARDIWIPHSGLVFPVRFEGHRSTNWQLMQRYLIDCARNIDSVLRSPLLISQLEQLAATTLLEVHTPLHGNKIHKPRVLGTNISKPIRLVEDYLHEHPDQAIRVEDLAALANISVRSLYAGFKSYCGISPMQYLRQIRLKRARADLINNTDPHRSVTDVALRWGFHQGRFSAEYKQCFGETPGQTLKNSNI